MSDAVELRPALIHSPKVRAIARALKGDDRFKEWSKRADVLQVNELLSRCVVGTLLVVWGTARHVAKDGVFPLATLEDIDHIAGIPGFAQAMRDAGWLSVRIDGIELPNFLEFNQPGPRPRGKAARKAAPAAKRAAQASEAFERFWLSYPRKKKKGEARKAWARVAPDADLEARILQAVERQKRSRDWLKEGGQFIPHPATWLNAAGWEDEVADAGPSTQERLERRRQEAQARKEQTPPPLSADEVRKRLEQLKAKIGEVPRGD